MTNAESFSRVRYWLDEINKHCQENIVQVLVGNKDDSKRPETSLANKVVSTELAQAYARDLDLTFFQTSAKENKNVDAVFHAVTRLALQRRLQSAPNSSALPSNIGLQQPRRTKKRLDDCCQ